MTKAVTPIAAAIQIAMDDLRAQREALSHVVDYVELDELIQGQIEDACRDIGYALAHLDCARKAATPQEQA